MTANWKFLYYFENKFSPKVHSINLKVVVEMPIFQNALFRLQPRSLNIPEIFYEIYCNFRFWVSFHDTPSPNQGGNLKIRVGTPRVTFTLGILHTVIVNGVVSRHLHQSFLAYLGK